MTKVKRILAILLSMAMILGMTVTTFAATNIPAETDVKDASAINIEATATVTAYQVVKGTYTSAGLAGYEAVRAGTIANPLEPTSDEITALAKSDLSGLKSVVMTGGTPDKDGLASFTANLNAGYWMVLVKGNVEEVYNPMLIGVSYSVDGMISPIVNANSNWTLVTENAYAKSTKPSINKEIVGGEKDVAIGETVNFKITTAIPSYSKEYTEVQVVITDELSKGLTLVENSIKINIPSEKYVLNASTSGFVLKIDSAYALANGGAEVTVEYSATLNDQAGLNFDANTNTAKLEYTNNPGGETKTTESRTYTYTFAIDSKLNGSSSESWNEITKEIVKGEIVKETTESGTKDVFKALAGATFTLTNNTSKKEYTATSDANGYLAFTGLDAGSYILKETAAPAGYSVNNAEIPVVISATYNTDGTLKSYSININNKATSTYEATYKGEGISTTVTNIVQGTGNASTEILNTKISELPSTGGIGTTIFTIGGCLIMIAAAAMLFASRRKVRK